MKFICNISFDPFFQIYALDYLLYNLRPYGIDKSYEIDVTPSPSPDHDLSATPWPGPAVQNYSYRIEDSPDYVSWDYPDKI